MISQTYCFTEASYTPLSPATDSSDTAADTQAVFSSSRWPAVLLGKSPPTKREKNENQSKRLIFRKRNEHSLESCQVESGDP